jgi:hypothetical protein
MKERFYTDLAQLIKNIICKILIDMFFLKKIKMHFYLF